MTPRDRKTLADNFADGRLPSEEAFSDLIHSMVNIVDDGLEKTPQDGLKVVQLGNDDKLASFFGKGSLQEPLWSIALSVPGHGGEAAAGQNLNFFSGSNHGTGLTLAADRSAGVQDLNSGGGEVRLGVNNSNPEHAIDTEGVVSSNGRIGREGGTEKRQVPADGEWHPIVTKLDGCHAFEIMAGVGKPGSGKYSLLHAFALSTFNSKKGSITRHQAHYSSKCDQIELRWNGTAHDYSLEMRTRCSFLRKTAGKDQKQEELYVRYFITQLWFDPFMQGCTPGGSEAKPALHKPKRKHHAEGAAASEPGDDTPAMPPRRKVGTESPLAKLWAALKSGLKR